jgi:uncharacterized protein YdeI (YjbR/CyaY-like superfamily)
MTEAGLERIREAKNSGEWFKRASVRKELVIPSYFREALAMNEKAQRNFDNLASSYKRNFVSWVSSAKREETRKRRLAEAIRLLEQNENLGMK